MKKLSKSSSNKKICGVCAGLGNYFGIDVTIVRLLWVFLSIATSGFGFLAYFIAALIMPYDFEYNK